MRVFLASICTNIGQHSLSCSMFFTRYKLLTLIILLIPFLSCRKPQGLQFTGFSNFNIQPLSFTNSKISLGIGVYNPNNFDIKVSHVDAEIELAGSKIGNYRLDSIVMLPANSPFTMPVELTVGNGVLLGNALGLLSGDSIPYSLSGKVKAGVKIGTAEIPFTYSGHLSQKDFNLAP